jgi:hypothetical protein
MEGPPHPRLAPACDISIILLAYMSSVLVPTRTPESLIDDRNELAQKDSDNHAIASYGHLPNGLCTVCYVRLTTSDLLGLKT